MNSRASKNLAQSGGTSIGKLKVKTPVRVDYPGQPNLIRTDQGDFPKVNKSKYA